MIKASEALEASIWNYEYNIESQKKEINQLIADTIKEGKFYIDLKEKGIELYPEVRKELESLGYKVNHVANELRLSWK